MHDNSIHTFLNELIDDDDTCRMFYSNQPIKSNKSDTKNYFEEHPFYKMFYSKEKEVKEEVVNESDEEEKEVKEDDVYEKINQEIIKIDSSNVILEEWEKKIVWDTPKIEDSENMKVSRVEEKEGTGKWGLNINKVEEVKETHQKSDGTWSIFPLSNDLLENDQWEDGILWDEKDVEHHRPVPLYLDLNDTGLLLKEAVLPIAKSTEEKEESNGANNKEVSATNNTFDKPSISSLQSLPSLGDTPEKPNEEQTEEKRPKKDRRRRENKQEERDKEKEKEEQKKKRIWIIKNKCDDINNDRYYYMGKTGYTQKKFIIYHSIPAKRLETFQTHLTKNDLQNFHRPIVSIKESQPIQIHGISVRAQQKRFNVNTTYVPQNMKELSSKDGKIHLIEYIEEYPPLLSQIGMGARIRNYCKEDDENLVQEKYKTGEMVVVERGEESPFLGKVKQGNPVQSIDNKMTKTPIHEFEVRDTDFLLIRSADGKSWDVREIDHLFVAGQQQPQKDTEVPIPGSKLETSFNKERLETAIYLSFLKSSTLRVTDFVYAFPNQTETTIRKILRKCADFNRKGNDNGGSWEKKNDYEFPTEEVLFCKMTPERVCCYESMMSGLMRLQDRGIQVFKYTQIVSAVQNNEEIRKRVEPLVEEVRKTPWTVMKLLVSEMNNTCQGDFVVKDNDPRHLFEYYKKPIQKQIGTAKLNAKIRDDYGDLRRLTLDDLKNNLRSIGINDNNKLNKSRWELVEMLKKERGRKLGLVVEGNNTKPTTNTESITKKRKNIKEIFQDQLQYISSNEVIDEEDESDDDDGFLKYMENMNRQVNQEENRKDVLQLSQTKRPNGLTHFQPILDANEEVEKGLIRKEVRKNRERVRRLKKKTPNKDGTQTEVTVDETVQGAETVDNEDKKSKEEEELIPNNAIEEGIKEKRETRRKKVKTNNERAMKGGLIDMLGDEENKTNIMSHLHELDKLKKRLDDCITYVRSKTLISRWFVNPVNPAVVRDYTNHVKQPMDLTIISNKVKGNKYDSEADFLEDIELIVENCYRFNTRSLEGYAPVIACADMLYEYVISFLTRTDKN